MLIPNILEQEWFVWALTVVGFYLVGFPVYLKIMSTIPNTTSFEENKMKFGVGNIIVLVFMCLALTYVSNFFTLILNQIISVIKGSEVINPLVVALDGSTMMYSFIVACVCAPII